jgi:ATP-binding cassette subfamily B protein
MQAAGRRRGGANAEARRRDNRALGRALRYLQTYPRLVIGATAALLVATAAQLAVPQFVQNIIDAIVNGALNRSLLELPAALQTAAAERLGLDLSGARAALEGAPNALVTAGIVVVLFAVARGLFTFAQNFWSQALSQEIAFGLRNDLFAKIQRLSFSYHDRNRTGQLMVRATDDVERLRGFIGQGLLMALQALLLMVGTLAVLFATNVRLTLVVLPVLPVAMLVFMGFGAIAQPLFREVQKRLSQVNTVLQEGLAGLKVIKAYATEDRERARFEQSNDAELEQRIRISRVFSFLFPFSRRHLHARRVAEVQPLPHLPVPADGAARLHHLADGAGRCQRRPHLRDPRRRERGRERPRRRRVERSPRRGRIP